MSHLQWGCDEALLAYNVIVVVPTQMSIGTLLCSSTLSRGFSMPAFTLGSHGRKP